MGSRPDSASPPSPNPSKSPSPPPPYPNYPTNKTLKYTQLFCFIIVISFFILHSNWNSDDYSQISTFFSQDPPFFPYPSQDLPLLIPSKNLSQIDIKRLHRIQRELNLRKNSSHLSFASQMRSFPWDILDASITSKDFQLMRDYSLILLQTLLPFVTKEPPVPTNTSCHPPPPTFPLRCKRLKIPRKVGVLVNFGFAVDTLEIHLQELHQVIDKFFILEATLPQNIHLSSKPSTWDLIKYTPRFYQFLPKVVHFIADDANSAQNEMLINSDAISNDTKEWSRERFAEEFRWKKFLEWNEATKYFDSNDLLGFGDVDEIPNRNSILFLKYCQAPSDPIDIGIWFPSPFLNTARQTDFPVTGSHSWTLGDPTYWTVKKALQHYTSTGRYPSRKYGSSRRYLLGGMHTSKYAYLPFQLVKDLTRTPTDLRGFQDAVETGKFYKKLGGNGTLTDKEIDKTVMNWYMRNNIRSGSDLNQVWNRRQVVKVPWFLNCNRARYPAWEGLYDKRLDSGR